MVADVLILKRQPSPSDGVKIFATSRRHMIEILVDDRNRNINGHYARWVIPVEKLRAKKDAEILHLRMTIRRYEIMFGITSAETHFIADLSTLDQELITVNSRLNSLRQACEDADERVLFLNKSVKNYEDHANEWKMAHSNAVDVVNKAEKLRADYAGCCKHTWQHSHISDGRREAGNHRPQRLYQEVENAPFKNTFRPRAGLLHTGFLNPA